MSLSFLDRFRPRQYSSASTVFDGLAQVRAYWEALRQGGALPPRSAIDPRGLAGVLDRVFMAERIGRGLVQIKLAGSGLADFAGGEVNGLPLSCLFSTESRPLLAQCVERVFAEPAVVELDLASDRGKSGQVIARLILLPLANAGGTPTLLGAQSFAAGAQGPCKLQLVGHREERIAPLTLVPLNPSFVPEAAEKPLPRRGHLRLVHFSG